MVVLAFGGLLLIGRVLQSTPSAFSAGLSVSRKRAETRYCTTAPSLVFLLAARVRNFGLQYTGD